MKFKKSLFLSICCIVAVFAHKDSLSQTGDVYPTNFEYTFINEPGLCQGVMLDVLLNYTGLPYTSFPVNTVEYLWEYGDGSTGGNQFYNSTSNGTFQAAQLQHYYDNSGQIPAQNFIIKLHITWNVIDLSGGPYSYVPYTKTYTFNIGMGCVNVNGDLSAISGYNGICNKVQLNLNNIDPKICGSNTAEYRWKYGDGNSSNWVAFNSSSTFLSTEYDYILPSNLFNKTYDASIEFRSTCGGSTSINSIPVSVSVGGPTYFSYFDFGYSITSCTSNQVTFNNASIYTAANAFSSVNYTWDFGDGTTSTASSPISHTYAAQGTYTVTLTADEIYDGQNVCIKKIYKTVILGGPIADFQPLAGCKSSGIQFTGYPANATSFTWDFGDGTANSSQQNPYHVYAPITFPATYACTLTVVRDGCSDTKIQNITIYDDVIASIAGPSVSCASGVNFSSTSTGATTYSWDFGNNTYGSGANPAPASYASAGFYTVTMTASNGFCNDVAQHIVEVVEAPTFNVTATKINLCPGETSNLSIDMTNFLNTNNYTYVWKDANNNVVYNGLNMNVSVGGTYTATVTANNCTPVSHSISITQHSVPDYKLDVDPTGANCINDGSATVKYLDGSTIGGSAVNLVWSHDAAVTALMANNLPSGQVYVQVTTTSSGCVSTIGEVIPSNEMVVVPTITNADCGVSNGKIDIEVSKGNPSYTYVWKNSSGTTISTTEDLINYPKGEYSITVTDQDACSITLVNLYIGEPVFQIAVGNLSSCGSGNVKVAAAATVIGGNDPANFTFIWFNDANPPVQIASQTTSNKFTSLSLAPGDYNVMVTDGNPTGCESDFKSFTVLNGQPVLLTTTGINPKCFDGNDGIVAALASNGQAPYTYSWEKSSVIVGSSAQVINLEEGVYSVTATDDRGCTATDNVTLTDPLEIDFSVTGSACNGTSASVVSSTGTPNYTVKWIRIIDPNTSNVEFSEVVTSPLYKSSPSNLIPGDYNVEVEDSKGCIKIDGPYIIAPADPRKIRFKYVWTGNSIPEVPNVQNPPDNIAAEVANDILDNVLEKVSNCVAKNQAGGDQAIQSCTSKENVNDRLDVSYNESNYQYTLYYYDRAGNLTKTVPPEGVNELTDAEIKKVKDLRRDQSDVGFDANHDMQTTYEYNSLGQLIEQTTPDGGTTKFVYNDLGQLRFSYNAEQINNNVFSYTKYDELGRVVESGEAGLDNLTYANLNDVSQLALNFSNPYDCYPSLNATEVNRTFYSQSAGKDYYGKNQRFLENRVSYTFRDEDGDLGTYMDRSYTYYSYDPHGNVEWLIQDLPGMTPSYIRYEYDLVSGNVIEVFANEYREDKFFQKYEYDADNRITSVKTSKDGHIWDEDANYDYYAHGPLKRTEIGEDHVQGMDYTYTIQGWLKAQNEPDLLASNDPGGDGGINSSFAGDVFGMTLNYFSGDFNRTGSVFNSSGSNYLASQDLYNGNISSWVTKSFYPTTGPEYDDEKVGRKFTYDQLNRIINSDFENFNGSTWSTSNIDYDSDYSYDKNGNLLTLDRNMFGASILDNLGYHYTNNTNRLEWVADSYTANEGEHSDIMGQHDYTYDDIGNLIQETYTMKIDESGWNTYTVVTDIEWNAIGKVKQVTVDKTGANNQKTILRFAYDASGNRIKKEVIKDETDPVKNTITYYLRDAQGNILATHVRSNVKISGTKYNAVFKLKELPIYGSDRIGQVNFGDPANEVILATIPFDASISEDVDFEYNGLKERTELADWITPANAKVTVATLGDVCGCELKEIDLTTATGSIENEFMGMVGNNVAVAENMDGILQFYSVTAENYMGHSNVCLIFDYDGELMKFDPSVVSTKIVSDPVAKSMIMQDMNNENIYYLINRNSADHKLYSTKIDMSKDGYGSTGSGKGQIVEVSTIIDNANNNYGRHMAILEDGINNVHRLYTTRHIATSNGMPGSTEIVSFDLQSNGSFANRKVVTTIPGYDLTGDGEIQLSADGGKLIVYNHNLYIGGFAHRAMEIMIYTLTADGLGVVSSENYLMVGNGGGNYQKGSADFTHPQDEFTFSQRAIFIQTPPALSTPAARLEKEHNWENALTNIMNTYEHGDTRRAMDRKNYVAGQENDSEMANMDISNTIGQQTFPTTANYKLSGHLPGQNIRKKYPDGNGIYQRQVGLKQYEVKDHLGNVRSVFSDHKIGATTGLLNNDFNNWAALNGGLLNVVGSDLQVSGGTPKGTYLSLSTGENVSYHIAIDILLNGSVVMFEAHDGTNVLFNKKITTDGSKDFYFTASGNATDFKAYLLSGTDFTLQNANFNVMTYVAEVQDVKDYYPFGMVMPGRSYTSDDYRYGFNGMEKDDEIKGAGNSLDFGARIYDARIGRWLATDPIMQPHESPYSYAANNPIIYIDKYGENNIIYLVALSSAKEKLEKAELEEIAAQANKMLEEMGLKTRVVLFESNEPFDPQHMDENDSYVMLGSTSEILETTKDNKYSHLTESRVAPDLEDLGGSMHPEESSIKGKGVFIDVNSLSGWSAWLKEGQEKSAAFAAVHGVGHNSGESHRSSAFIMSEGARIVAFINQDEMFIGEGGKVFSVDNKDITRVDDMLNPELNKDFTKSMKATFGTDEAKDNYKDNKMDSDYSFPLPKKSQGTEGSN